MAKTEKNIKAAEDFIRSVLAKNFGQQLEQDQLRAAAEKLCEAVPEQQPEAAY